MSDRPGLRGKIWRSGYRWGKRLNNPRSSGCRRGLVEEPFVRFVVRRTVLALVLLCSLGAGLVPAGAATQLSIDSVDGQRSRPSGLVRLDLLKLVASSPALRARPEAVIP